MISVEVTVWVDETRFAYSTTPVDDSPLAGHTALEEAQVVEYLLNKATAKLVEAVRS